MSFYEKMACSSNSTEGMSIFNKNLDQKRADLVPVFPQKKNHGMPYESLEAIENLETGEYLCFFEGIKIHFLIQKKESDYCYVLFNGALGKNISNRSKYQRWSWSNLVDACFVNILDPMYFEYDKLPIGWYWGTREQNYREIIGNFIQRITSRLNVKHLLLYGSSAGGTAATYTAHYVPGCTAVALNAQLRPWKHEWHTDFKEIVGIDTQMPDVYKRNDIEWHVTNTKNCKFILAYNCRSRVDFNWQLVPFAQKMNWNLNYGISEFDNIYTWIWDSGIHDNHSYLDYQALFPTLDHVFRQISSKGLTEELQKEVYRINELWRDHWEMKSK